MSGEEVTFGRFRFDLARRELSRDGIPVRLGSRALDVLAVLAAARGDVVTKDELLARVWPGQVVEENNLQVQASALRKALDEGKSGQSYLVTVPGRGYRLIGMAGGSHGPALPDKPSIAVLPFQNMSDDPQQEYFADGIVEDIITALCHMRWLFVIARDSSFAYKGRTADVKQVGRELGVRYVVEGGIRKAAQRVRITAQLIDASTGAHLWADHFDGDLKDIFDLQDQVTASVVGAIAPKLEQAEIERAKRKPTGSLDAYDYFLRGMASTHRMTREATSEALDLFARATELDPDFASPYGVAAFCYVVRKINGWTTDRSARGGRSRAAGLAGGGARQGRCGRARFRWARPRLRRRRSRRSHRAHRPGARSQSKSGGGVVRQRYGAGVSRRRAGRGDRAPPSRDAPEPVRSFHVHHAGRDRIRPLLRRPLRRGHGMGRKGVLGTAEHPRDPAHRGGQQCTRRPDGGGAQGHGARALELDPEMRVSNLEGRIGRFRRPEDFAKYADALRKAGLPE